MQLGSSGEFQYYAPVPAVFASNVFGATHCFDLRESKGAQTLEFEPLPGREVSDVAGVVWFDAVSGRPDSIAYTYTNLEPLLRRHEVPKIVADVQARAGRKEGRIRVIGPRLDRDVFGGRLNFTTTDSGHFVLSEWTMRVPILWGRSRWIANPANEHGLLIEITVIPLPFERHGRVTRLFSRDDTCH